MSGILNVILGILILFFSSAVLIGLYSIIYVRYLVKSENETGTNKLLSIVIASLIWIGATFVSILAASAAGIFVFALVALTFIFSINFLLCEKLLGISGKHKLLYSLTLGVIFNPAWLSLLGVI